MSVWWVGALVGGITGGAAAVRGDSATLFVIKDGVAEKRKVAMLGESGGSLFVPPTLAAGSQVVTTIPARQFTAALRLSQPWNVQEMIDLHAAAADETPEVDDRGGQQRNRRFHERVLPWRGGRGCARPGRRG